MILKKYAVLCLAVFAIAGMGLFAQSAEAAYFSVDLSIGSTGSDVTALQQYLAADASLYPEALVTGYFGVLTQAAVKRFQARYDIIQTGYVGPITRSKLNSLMGSGSGSVIVGGDVNAPIMSVETTSVSGTNATISWTTSEPARSRVMYATSYPFLYAVAPSGFDASVDSAASVTLSGLSPSTTYYYVRESVDASGNVMWTTKQTFKTGI